MRNPGGAPASSKKKKKGHHAAGGGASTDLHVAARNGDLSAVVSICSTNPLAVNSRDGHSRTPLHLAAWSGQTEVVRFLCKNKAEILAAAMDDTTAIHFAAQKGHLEIIRTLLSYGVSVKAGNRKGFTPLHFAVQGSHLELIKYLIKKGASLTSKTKAGQTPADLASTEEVRSLLVEPVQLPTKDEKSPTQEICEPGSKDSVEEENGDSLSKEIADVGEESTGINKKRKDEDATVDSSSKPKKNKISLDHLLAEDDDELDGEE